MAGSPAGLSALLLLLLAVRPGRPAALYPANLQLQLPQLYSQLDGVLDSMMEVPDVPSPMAEGHWPRRPLNVGPVSGVAVDTLDRPVIFHRANHSWEATSFNKSQHYQDAARGPILSHTLLTLNPGTGAVLKSEGSGRFYLPHGLHIDAAGNRWITDVALHQVFKLPPDSDTPILTLGVPFEPGSDAAHFCKPTDVAVAEDGTIFVADGYCNRRIMIFDREGRFLGSLGEEQGVDLLVPHSLSLDGGVLCVADREHGRVVCWNIRQRLLQPQIINLALYGRIYAVSVTGDVLLAVFKSLSGGGVLTIDLVTGLVLDSWVAAQGLNEPHDLAVTSDGRTTYVGELVPARVSKFVLQPDFYERP
ncbi:peptidyl-glycine alpha-amidating monooxygenase B-like [Amphibalanus amphitrite]|uniref:peptidyl-glycine alpha-amidating monooxygenase B-like n=1 Tax=Amphibalanus amphitrite TaxID=1232801 RepID=UPI001C9273DF|nr:peptidyl-glycine alpha-amidating monooxygenase B-like [Amphibalanus amphitrite]